jgi:hypothetical protein
MEHGLDLSPRSPVQSAQHLVAGDLQQAARFAAGNSNSFVRQGTTVQFRAVVRMALLSNMEILSNSPR